MRKQIDFNKIVNVERNEENQVTEIKVLSYAFSGGSGFAGLTGNVFEPIRQDCVDQVLEDFADVDTLQKYWFDNIGELLTISDAEEILEDEMEILRFFGGLDDSYSGLWDYFYEELNIDPKEFPYFNCTGGGRCFDASEKFNFAPELEYLLEKYEN